MSERRRSKCLCWGQTGRFETPVTTMLNWPIVCHRRWPRETSERLCDLRGSCIPGNIAYPGWTLDSLARLILARSRPRRSSSEMEPAACAGHSSPLLGMVCIAPSTWMAAESFDTIVRVCSSRCSQVSRCRCVLAVPRKRHSAAGPNDVCQPKCASPPEARRGHSGDAGPTRDSRSRYRCS